MHNFKTLKCNNCNTVITNLPEAEIKKLGGQLFLCDSVSQIVPVLSISAKSSGS